MDALQDEKLAALKMGGGAAAVTIYGFTLNEVVALCTIAYFVLQIGLLLPRYAQMFRGWFKRKGPKQ